MAALAASSAAATTLAAAVAAIMGGGMEAVAATAEAVAEEVGLGSERCGACPRAQPLAAWGPRYFESAAMAAVVAAGHQELPVCPAPAVRALSKAPIVNGGDSFCQNHLSHCCFQFTFVSGWKHGSVCSFTSQSHKLNP